MLEIVTQPVPSQRVSAVLDGQNCQINIYQRSTGLYVDLNADGVDVSVGVRAKDAQILNPCTYNPFDGQLYIVDTQGSDDPDYTGMGSRFRLVYFTQAEVDAI